MMSKILFLTLIGCAVVLAAPAKKSVDFEVKEISEEEAQEFMKHIKEKLDKWYEQIKENVDDEEFLKTFEEIKKVFDEIFNQQKLENGNESQRALKRALLATETLDEEEDDTNNISQQIEVKEITKEEAEEMLKNMKEKFEKFIEEIDNEEIKKGFEKMKKFVEHIFEEMNEEN